MPDNNENNGNLESSGNITENDQSDILSSLLGNNRSESKRTNDLLRSIDDTLKKLLRNGSNMSMSNMNNMRSGYNGRENTFSRKYFDNYDSRDDSFSLRDFSGAFDAFENELEKQLLQGLLGVNLNGLLKRAFTKFADDIGVSVKDIPKTLGSTIGRNILSTDFGSSIAKYARKKTGNAISKFQSRYQAGVNEYYEKHPEETRSLNYSQSFLKSHSENNNIRSHAEKNPTKTNSSEFSTKEIIINASKVIISETGKIENTKEKITNVHTIEEEEPQTVDTYGQLRQILDENLGRFATDSLSETGLSQLTDLLHGGGSVEEVKNFLSGNLGGLISEAGAGKASQSLVANLGIGNLPNASAALSGLTKAASALKPVLGSVALAFVLINKVASAFAPAIEGIKEGLEGVSKAANRYSETRKKDIDEAQKRLEADVRTMVETPFKILESAAQEWYNAWDNNIRIINGTQGYNKEELQSLMSSFAERLRSEGLTNVVSAADITDNLAKVLESGLSGKVAEEFAYTATKLNAAVPTQDFFSYADTYASIAANAIRAGESQDLAIAEANAQLEAFANNVLYASREVAGGFTTGLKNAETLFEQSVKIAQTGKTNNAAEISGVMTAVSAITGAIAPDLASSMTDAIYRAATGGNSSEIVALRSLAGINASNTEFLKELNNNPKEVFSNLFSELAKRQNMSEDAYMEVAEGLSNIFGVSMDAFARVDFEYLANAIASMNTSSTSLDENMNLLMSGETTTTAEQLKMQQINEVILDEGLAYVLDNEAARAVQEHMWDEQIERELIEATYGVEIQGAALKFLEGIRQTIDNILSFLIPFRKAASVVATVEEEKAQEADIKQMLELGKVGSGRANELYNLTTRNKNLDITDDLLSLLGGYSEYEFAVRNRRLTESLYHPLGASNSESEYSSSGRFTSYNKKFTGESLFKWGTVGKSTANALFSPVYNANAPVFATLSSLSGTSQANTALSTEKLSKNSSAELLNKALSGMSDFVAEDTEHEATYDDWVKSLKKKYGIKDLDKLLEENNISEESVKGQFDALQTQVAAQERAERDKREEKFWEDTVSLLRDSEDGWLSKINTHIDEIHTILSTFFDKTDINTNWSAYFESWQKYFSDWTAYVVNSKIYNDEFTNTEKYDTVVRQEKDKSDTAALALAEALTNNDINALVDPTLQTNVLLAEILKTTVALLSQTKSGVGSLSLPDTLAGLSLGIVNT